MGTLITSGFSSAIGPAVGGAVGGVAVISAIVLCIVFRKRRRSLRGTVEFDSEPGAQVRVPVSNLDATPAVGVISQHGSTNMATGYPQMLAFDQASLLFPPQPTKFSEPHIPYSYSTVPPQSTPPTSPSASPITDVMPSTQDSTASTDADLASQEARFLRGLYSRNVPPHEIAELMQAMQVRRESFTGAGGSSRPTVNTNDGSERQGPPPVY